MKLLKLKEVHRVSPRRSWRNPAGSSSSKTTIKCFCCGKIGHTSGKIGHLAKICRSSKEDNRKHLLERKLSPMSRKQ